MFQAFGNYLVVKPLDGVEKKTTGGILLAGEALEQENSKRSEIISISNTLGSKAYDSPHRKLNIGDIVHSKFYAGVKVYHDGNIYICLQYEDVMAVEYVDEVS